MVEKLTITVALIGNPNTGKSTLFNCLSGLQQRVGNYPGVTVEKKIGRLQLAGQEIVLVDLPGTYSLAARSLDEMVAVDVLLGRRSDVDRIDAVLCIVDASNIERNLYLVSQVLELGLPTIVALNMIDVAADKGLQLDVATLESRLGIPVIPIQANRHIRIAHVREVLARAKSLEPPRVASPFPIEFQREVDSLISPENWDGKSSPPRYLVERLLLDVSGYIEQDERLGVSSELRSRLQTARNRLQTAGCPVPAVEAMSRYQWAAGILDGILISSERPRSISDRIDAVLTHRVWGLATFVLIMLALFQSVFWVAEPASRGIDAAVAWANGRLEAGMSPGPLRSLLTDGVINGVGGVLVFLPQIFTLFLFIGILEDCGYMARAAYLMDRVMAPMGLSGRSFIPLLSSFACAIPGIMATRVIENSRDRLATILVAPLMSCSARLPVYSLLIRAFIPETRVLGPFLTLHGLTMFVMYALGVVAAVAVVLVLKRTALRGPPSMFVLELPSYKFPGLFLVLHRMFDRGWAFVRRAGTLILAVSVLVWAAAYYPHDEASLPAALRARQAELEARLDTHAPEAQSSVGDSESVTSELEKVRNAIDGEHLRASYLGRVGRSLEPIVRPLGWDWRIGCAVISSFPAREVVIATLGVIYNLGSGHDEESETLHAALQTSTWDGTNQPVFSVPVALSLMVFFSLCAQCASTLVVMRRETGTWRWPAFTFVYMTSLAYVAALLTFQVGSRL